MPDQRHVAPRRSLLWLVYGLVAVLLGALIVTERSQTRSTIERQELARLQTLARVIDVNLAIHLEANDKLLIAVRDRLAQVDPARRAAAVAAEMRFFVESTPGVRSLSVLDADGTVIASSRPEVVGLNFAERTYYKAAQATRDPRMTIVGGPLQTALNAFTVPMARPVFDAGGHFSGAVVLFLDPEFFKNMLSAVLYADDLRCLLIYEDGRVFQSVGDTRIAPGANVSTAGSLFSQHKAGGQRETLLNSRSTATGDQRFGALRTVLSDALPSDTHLVISFTRNVESAFAPWKRDTLLIATVALVLLQASGALLAWYDRQRALNWRREDELRQEREAAELARQQAALEIADLYEHAPCGYHSLDAQGRFLRINQTELDWLGLRREDVIGKMTFQSLLNPEDAELFRKNFDQFKQAGRIHDLEFRLRHADGQAFWVMASATAIYDADGNYLASRSTVSDISERKRIEADLAQQTREAIQANQAKSTFLSTMSHEIRTPLNAIVGTAYLLRLSPLDAAQRGDLDTIQIASQNLLALINDILDLSRIEAGDLAIASCPFSLTDVLDELRAMFAASAASKGLRLDIAALPGGLPADIEADGNRLRQILINLLNNAIKFTPAGQVDLRITAHDREAQSNLLMLRFTVTDTGIGIAPETLARLFQPFTQADASTSRQFGGSGLGLSIVKRQATLMGGAVGADSQPGVGSTFWVELPFGIASAGRPLARKDREQGRSFAAGGALAGARVLVVDDSPINLNVIQRILASEGALATGCTSGAQVLARLQEAPLDYDAVLMDLQMPGMDGCETTVRIREELKLLALPVIALTASATTTERQRALAAGMNDFLTKPVEPERLVDVLHQHVARFHNPALPRRAAQDPLRAPGAGDSAPEAWPEIPGVDAQEASRLLDGDVAFFRALLQQFVDENAGVVAEIQAMLDAGDGLHAARRVHKLRGQAGNIGAKRLQEAAGALEEALNAGAADIAARFTVFSKAAKDFFSMGQQ